MSFRPKYKVITYYQSGENAGIRHECRYCFTLEEARARREFFIELDNVKSFILLPTIWELRQNEDNTFDFYYLEG